MRQDSLWDVRVKEYDMVLCWNSGPKNERVASEWVHAILKSSSVPMGRSRLELMILGNMKNDPSSLMLLTVMKNLRGLGYMLQVRGRKDEYTDADIDGIREECSTFVANFIFR
ncbi:hypothetical protein L1987_07283 [Smallanthus sonchifolius]|uniref:Uncharacterized protein n=1 Tax=Smallanthus sonchifolius TaxID=185202 RepID=A0ACB9K0H3_9ASTR|nr:hypothetical protein L1987_07283 [Smallanthus sonchifolius]